MLYARQLVEAGTRLVTVNMFGTVFGNTTWDCHADGGALGSTLEDYRDTLCPTFDMAYSALLDDLHRRGMLANTLVLAMGEFGRTPLINPRGGRDHWTGCWSVLFAGAGIRAGQAVRLPTAGPRSREIARSSRRTSRRPSFALWDSTCAARAPCRVARHCGWRRPSRLWNCFEEGIDNKDRGKRYAQESPPNDCVFSSLGLGVWMVQFFALRAENWPLFRGADAGVSAEKGLPTSWDVSKNVAWVAEVPGRGWSSPIVWGKSIFLTSVNKDGAYEDAKKGLYFGGERAKPADVLHHWLVICLDLETGHVRCGSAKRRRKSQPTAFTSRTPTLPKRR